MRLTERDTQLFKILNGSETGAMLVDYLERLKVSIRDCENWTKEDTKESSQRAAKTIQSELIDKIKLQTQPKKTEVNQFT